LVQAVAVLFTERQPCVADLVHGLELAFDADGELFMVRDHAATGDVEAGRLHCALDVYDPDLEIQKSVFLDPDLDFTDVTSRDFDLSDAVDPSKPVFEGVLGEIPNLAVGKALALKAKGEDWGTRSVEFL